MRIAFYLRSQSVQCRYGGYFLGSALSLRAALPSLRRRYERMASRLDAPNARRTLVLVRSGPDA